MKPKTVPRLTPQRWIEFYSADSTTRVSKVNDLHNQYERDGGGRDFWIDWRRGIANLHEMGLGKDALKNLWTDSADRQKAQYRSACKGYGKFWGRKTLTGRKFDGPTGTWIAEDVRVTIRPDLLLSVGAGPALQVVLYLNKDLKLDQRHANPFLAMMEATLSDRWGVAVLDVHQGRLFTPTKRSDAHLIHMEAEAAAFNSIWRKVAEDRQ